jgi:hypothetical protein
VLVKTAPVEGLMVNKPLVWLVCKPYKVPPGANAIDKNEPLATGCPIKVATAVAGLMVTSLLLAPPNGLVVP